MITKNTGIHKALFTYWIVMVIWQNIQTYSARSSIDIAIKVVLIIFLGTQFFKYSGKRTIGNFSVLIVLILCMLGTAISDWSFTASGLVSYTFPIMLFFLTFCVGNRMKISEKEYLKYLEWIIYAVLYMALYSFVFRTEYFLGASSITSAYGTSLSSFFVSNHEYAMYLVFGIIACVLCYQKSSRSHTKKIFYLFALSIFIINLVFTFSRTAQIACIAFFVVIALLSGKRKLMIGILLTAGILLLLYFSLPELKGFIDRVVIRADINAGREFLFNQGIEIFKEGSTLQKVLGHGYVNAQEIINSRTGHSSLHNAFIQVLVTNGVCGLILLLSAFIYNIRSGISFIKIDKFWGAVFSAFALMGAAFMLTNTTVYFYSPVDSTILTVFTLVIPKYVRNAILSNRG